MKINDKELEIAMTLIISNLVLLSEQDADRVLHGMSDTVKSIRERKNVKEC